ncbi:MAG: NAD(P)-binding domain-containing protein [Planctomycetota bacterium]
MHVRTRVLIVGAGPIGLETAWECKRRGIEYIQVEKGPIGSTITCYPQETTFFSSADRIGIAGVPLVTPGQRKATKEEYLAYLRQVVVARGLEVRAYEEVRGLRRDDDGFLAHTDRGSIRADAVVLATGDMARTRSIGIEGEELPHVSHEFVEPHRYFGQRLLIVGGKNSAVEAALRCWHAGAHVTLSYRREEFDARHVKYWLLPELKGRIHRGEIACFMPSEPLHVTATHVTLREPQGDLQVPADFVLLLTGYEADMSLFRMLGAELEGRAERPRVDEQTMQTSVPGLYVAGTATAGTQYEFSLFIENCHIHARRIGAALAGEPPPDDPPPLTVPES